VPLTQLALVSGSGPSSPIYHICICVRLYRKACVCVCVCVRVRFVFVVRGYDFVHVLPGFFGKSFNCQVAKANRPAIGIFPQFICLLRPSRRKNHPPPTILEVVLFIVRRPFSQGRVKLTKFVKLWSVQTRVAAKRTKVLIIKCKGSLELKTQRHRF